MSSACIKRAMTSMIIVLERVVSWLYTEDNFMPSCTGWQRGWRNKRETVA